MQREIKQAGRREHGGKRGGSFDLIALLHQKASSTLIHEFEGRSTAIA
jgi:hypothetical protein